MIKHDKQFILKLYVFILKTTPNLVSISIARFIELSWLLERRNNHDVHVDRVPDAEIFTNFNV